MAPGSKPKKVCAPEISTSGTNCTTEPLTTNRPRGCAPVAVRMETLPLLMLLGSTSWLNFRKIGWFCAMALMVQPAREQPRLQVVRQKAFPPPLAQSGPGGSPPPLLPEHPASTIVRRTTA
ncbi:MAG: hypothetical protein ACYTGW_17810 [Planctomycetota bacterium]